MERQRRLIVRLGLGTLLLVLLTILMLELFGEPSPSAYNARTLGQLQQYVTALELVRLEAGEYPRTEHTVCLGDYPDDACWDNNGSGIKESAEFNDVLDTFLPILSAGRFVEDTTNPSESREGYTYRSIQEGRSYEIQYLLVGKNKPCGFGSDLGLTVEGSKQQEHTLCTIRR